MSKQPTAPRHPQDVADALADSTTNEAVSRAVTAATKQIRHLHSLGRPGILVVQFDGQGFRIYTTDQVGGYIPP